MRHPSDGTLRRLVDEPAGVPDADRAHVADCPVCLTGLVSVREDAAAVSAALDVDTAPDVDAAWQRMTSAGSDHRVAQPAPSRRWRRTLRSPVAAAVGAAVVLAGGGVAAAADWIQVFRTERVAPVSVSESDLLALPDLAGYGELTAVEDPGVHEVSLASTAAQDTGLPVPHVADLPRGVVGEPAYQVGDRATAVFTFSADKAARTAARQGEELPPVPTGLDGAKFRITAGPGVAAVWTAASGLPAMVVARAEAPTVDSSGVSFETARDYLLSLPGIPDDLAAQLRTLSADGSTLPVPVPAGEVSSSTADVNGTEAQVFASRDGLLNGVVWVRDGMVTVVAGSLSGDEVLDVARHLGTVG